MRFNYRFHERGEVIVAEFESDVALPGIEVGNELILTTDSYGKLGGVLHIESIRVATSHLDGEFKRYDLDVFCRFGDPKEVY